MADDEKNDAVATKNLDRDVEMSRPDTPPSQPSQSSSLEKAESKTNTSQSEIVVVPRSERRGLLGRFCLVPEITNPREYGNKTKWAMTVVVSFAAVASSTGSSIFYREYYCLIF